MKTNFIFHRKKAVIAIIGIIAASTCFVSCKDEGLTPPPSTGSFFDYRTTLDYTLNLNLSPTGNAIGVTRFEVYTSLPLVSTNDVQSRLETVKPVFTGFTDSKGQYSDIITLPTSVKIIYVYTQRPGIKMLRTATIEGYNIVIDEASSSEELRAPAVFDYSTITATNTFTYTTWDANGVPASVYQRDVISPALSNDIATSLPEGIELAVSHPEYIDPNAVTEIVITDTVLLDVAFVHEGAGYKNVLGYYYYPTGNPPALNALNKYIAFPNTSFAGSGGGLYAGDRVHLMFKNGATYTNKFPPGYTVGWFLIANGYNSTSRTVTNGLYTHYSNPAWNNEANAALKQHVVQLYDNVNQLIVLSFEDIRRDYPSCDKDFNDAIFYVVPSPISSINTTGLSQIDRGQDSDGDGVSDDVDEFPNDPTMAARVHYPSQGSNATLAYEDLWPSQGDYDMNDLVVDYNFIHFVNATNNVVRSDGTLTVRASGAKFLNGFGIELGVTPSDINTVSVTGGSLTEGVITNDAKGLELGQSKANIILFDNVYKLFNLPSGSFINTVGAQPTVTSETINLSIVLNSPQPLATIKTPPYNAYLIADCGNNVRGREVHLSGHHPTDKADQNLFSTGQDITNPSINRYYIASNNMPFAIKIPQTFSYPAEKNSISDAYIYFNTWASSFGAQYANWYSNVNYRNNGLIYGADAGQP